MFLYITVFLKKAAEELLERCRNRGETLEPLFELTNFHEAAKAVNTAIAETKVCPSYSSFIKTTHCRFLRK